mmetsp:Transcript_10748/g.22844  ORF Transcript_10748/g.22844 Transcript_10748/m.22844 type:complete len:117 (+) Transcript_10748:1296-1646(+)
MTTVNPFTKPSMTGCGTSRINLPVLRKTICKIPASKAHTDRYGAPIAAQSGATTTEQAPLAELQIPGLPPKAAATKPKRTVVHNPTSGETPATYENEIASGIMASETASPAARLLA